MDNIKFSTDISGKHSIDGLPICEEETGRVVAVFYNDYEAEYVIKKVNSHDALTARVAELEAALNKIIKLDEAIHCFEDGETQICNVASKALENKS
jgi:hypothetical protein